MLEVAEQPGGEAVRVVDRDLRDAVERSLRLLQEDAGYGAETVVQHVAAVLIFGDDIACVGVAERVDSDSDKLRESGWREPTLRHPITRVIHFGVLRHEGAEADS